MKVLILAALVIAASCQEEISSKIVGGRDANIYEYPFMATVRNLGVFPCGGAIINQRSVLTAAHCLLLSGLSASITVTVGSSRREGQGGETYRALRLYLHPEYHYVPEPFELRNDIAVVRTVRTIRYGIRIQPIPLARDSVPTGATVTAVGWGLLGDSFLRDRADQLQQLDMRSISNIACILRHIGTEAEGQVSSEKICLENSGADGICSGDSGSPLVWQGRVAGVATWTIRPCGSHPSVYIRVSEHVDWIESVMEN